MRTVGKIAKSLVFGIYALCGIALVVFLVPGTGYRAKSVATGSMRPAVPPGALVIIHSVPLSELQVGDIVTYRSLKNPSESITHRIVSEEKKQGIPFFTTKGDANPTTDPEIAGGAIYGRVVAQVPVLGAVFDFVKKPLGLLLIILLPGILVIYDESKRLRRMLNSSDKKDGTEEGTPPSPPAPRAPSEQARPAVVARPKTPGRRMDGILKVVLPVLSLPLAAGVTYASLQTNSVTLGPSTLSVLANSDQCKNNGWQNYKKADGTAVFKNQGQCVASVVSNSHSQNQISL